MEPFPNPYYGLQILLGIFDVHAKPISRLLPTPLKAPHAAGCVGGRCRRGGRTVTDCFKLVAPFGLRRTILGMMLCLGVALQRWCGQRLLEGSPPQHMVLKVAKAMIRRPELRNENDKRTPRIPCLWTYDHRRLYAMQAAGCCSIRVQVRVCKHIQFAAASRKSIAVRSSWPSFAITVVL